jgi:peptide/nickel transport system substrate-binding protein
MRRRTLMKSAAATLLAARGSGAASLAAPAVAQPANTATLRFVPQANLTLLDPVFTTATVTSNHGYYVFDTLYSVGPDGASHPQMAEGHTISDDKLTWRIKLREGLVFHDGSPVRATDCIASIQRWAVRDPFGQLLAAAVDSYSAADDRTLVIKLSQPFPLLAMALGKPDSSVPFVMPERLARTAADKPVTEMVGSGPYRFIANEYVNGSRVVYEKFDKYVSRAEPAIWATGAKQAHFSRIVWHIIPDAATAGAALQNNEIDWWEQPLADLLPKFAADKNLALQVDQPWGRISWLILNQAQPPFNDARIRRAVMMATRQDDYMRATFGDDPSLWRISKDVFPFGTPYYSGADGDAMKGDLSVAAKMLREAGYAGQKVVVMNPTDFAAIHPLGLVTADILKQIGMNIELQETDWGTVVQRRASMEPVEKGGWSAFHTFASSATASSPATHPLITGRGAKGWFGWWDNADAQALTAQWLSAPDSVGQEKAAKALSHVAMTDVATVPVGQWYGKTAFRRSITGVLQGVSPYPWNVRPA